MKPVRSTLGGCLLLLAAGCTTFTVTQTDVSNNERIITSKIRAIAWFSSAQSIANLKAVQTDKTQSFGSSALAQQGATNIVAALEAIERIISHLK